MGDMSEMSLRVESDPDQIQVLGEAGFCLVECSVGGRSLVCDLEMDHHNDYSHLPGVAVSAYKRTLFGARQNEPRFVTCPPVDADACFAVAALAGRLPHPMRAAEFAKAPEHVARVMTKDWANLAETINAVDVEPIGLNLTALPHGGMILVWNAMIGPNPNGALSFHQGVGMWVSLLTQNPVTLQPLLEGAVKAEEKRRELSLQELESKSRRTDCGRVTAMANTEAWGFDIWYDRISENPSDDPEGWDNPVVLALASHSQEITIGCPNQAVAEALFGKGGLKNVLPKLEPSGWGGREAVGGSPRGKALSVDLLHTAADKVSELIR